MISTLIDNIDVKDLTVKKTETIIQRDKSVITGFVLTDESGNVGVVDKGAVRWFTKEQWWQLLHP